MKKSDAMPGQPASALISERIAEFRDWRGKNLRFRACGCCAGALYLTASDSATTHVA